VGIDVGLNEANVAFNNGANVFDPVARAILVRLDGTSCKALDVVLEHRTLVGVCGNVDGFGQIFVDFGELSTVIAIDDFDVQRLAIHRDLV